MTAHVQTVLALAAVAATAAAFLWRAIARRGRGGCGEACACAGKKLRRAPRDGHLR